MKLETNDQLRPPMQDSCRDIMLEKYAIEGETTAEEIRARVERAVGETLDDGFLPGGRINASAGAGRATTMINCFVQPVGDSITGADEAGRPGIMMALAQAAETMRRGGGVGYDFSAIRPENALVRGTGSCASGVVSYMRVFDRMCETVESAGARRGAQMGVLRVDHPDIEAFVDAKLPPDFLSLGLDNREAATLSNLLAAKPAFGWEFRKAFRTLSNFNLSVAVTDAFMDAVIADDEFDLVHEAAPANRDVPTKRCADGVMRHVYRTIRARDLWAKMMRNTFGFGDPGIIFIDRVNKVNNLWYVETIFACNPCGEQFLPAYGCCDLGSVMLQRCVRNPFTKDASFDFDRFERLVRGGVRFLDRVLDTTLWPLPEQRDEAMNKRRIGLGYLALGDALAMLGLKYDSDAAREFATKVTRTMRDTAYRESVELAKEFGPFPLFNADDYLRRGTFASELPQEIQDAIRTFGIRNSHLLSIAPTGTLALSFGDNCSSGVEPIYAKRQKRNKLMPDGTRAEFFFENAAYRQFRLMHGEEADDSVFQTALDLSVDAHLSMVEAIAPYIDSAISKTINIPADYPFEDFEAVYMKAYKAGLKGITTYRPNEWIGQVISDAGEGTTNAAADAPDPDRRVVLKADANVKAALRWPDRPATPQGTAAATYWVTHPQGSFAVVVSRYRNGRDHPLEVLVAGNEQPRGLAAIAKSLSVDMRTGDGEWLRKKIDSLRNTVADDGFSMHDPYTGKLVEVPSLVSGFAFLVEHSLEQFGGFDGHGEAPMMEALFSKREPKTGPRGSIGWGVDVKNDVTGDDFLMHMKEVQLEDGTVRPYSVWLSGQYPRVLDGLAKSLSIDMRVSDPRWVVLKLQKLLSFGELRGDFMGFAPEGGQRSYPSTVAYMAALLLDRFKVLGLGQESSIAGTAPAAPQQMDGAHAPGTGQQCPSCKTNNLHRENGCKSCSNCGHMGECG